MPRPRRVKEAIGKAEAHQPGQGPRFARTQGAQEAGHGLLCFGLSGARPGGYLRGPAKTPEPDHKSGKGKGREAQDGAAHVTERLSEKRLPISTPVYWSSAVSSLSIWRNCA